MVLYIAGKYSGDVEANILAARRVAVQLWEAGHAVICPHLNTARMETDCSLPYEGYLKGDLQFIDRCDAIVMLDGWQDSKGAVLEHSHAKAAGVPIYYYPDVPPLHPTEVRCPVQSSAFVRFVMNMYRTHLRKNEDYSPANVLATGEVGLVTRLWDKVSRLLSLTGFVFTVEKGTYAAPKIAKNESIEDTLLDTAVYAVIGRLLRNNEWGK